MKMRIFFTYLDILAKIFSQIEILSQFLAQFQTGPHLESEKYLAILA